MCRSRWNVPWQTGLSRYHRDPPVAGPRGTYSADVVHLLMVGAMSVAALTNQAAAHYFTNAGRFHTPLIGTTSRKLIAAQSKNLEADKC